MSSVTNAVVVDLAKHPDVEWAVVWGGQLLPVRFANEAEAALHLYGMQTGKALATSERAVHAGVGRTAA